MHSTYRDPVTGDILDRSDWVSWKVQGVIRRWSFLGVISIATFTAWLTDNVHVILWWNLCASYMALVIESIIGLAQFSQTKRDAVIMREIRGIAKEIHSLMEEVKAKYFGMAAQSK